MGKARENSFDKALLFQGVNGWPGQPDFVPHLHLLLMLWTTTHQMNARVHGFIPQTLMVSLQWFGVVATTGIVFDAVSKVHYVEPQSDVFCLQAKARIASEGTSGFLRKTTEFNKTLLLNLNGTGYQNITGNWRLHEYGSDGVDHFLFMRITIHLQTVRA